MTRKEKRPLPSQEALAELLDYDPESGLLRWRARPREMFTTARDRSAWNTRYAGRLAGTRHCGGYLQISLKVPGCVVLAKAHRIIWKLLYGVDPDEVDHIDGDGINNRLVNLRDVSRQENARNVARPVTNTSGVAGVRWDEDRGRWNARIQVCGKTRHLGRFNDFAQAVAARTEAERRFGFHPNHGRQAAQAPALPVGRP